MLATVQLALSFASGLIAYTAVSTTPSLFASVPFWHSAVSPSTFTEAVGAVTINFSPKSTLITVSSPDQVTVFVVSAAATDND